MVSEIAGPMNRKGRGGSKSGSLRDLVIGLFVGLAISRLLQEKDWTSTTPAIDCPPVKECHCPDPVVPIQQKAAAAAEETPKVGGGVVKSFYDIGSKMKTDKVQALQTLPKCLEDPKSCTRPGCVNERCRSWGHYYHTMYQNRLAPYSIDGQDPFQFLEIGFFKGAGYQTYREFLADTAEPHTMEIACGPQGPEAEGKWPYGNHANANPNYQQYIDEKRLHCGNAASQSFLNKVWKEQMRRPGAPPLKVVVDDGSHLGWHMVQSVLFWFPRIEPGGILIVEDIQPIGIANKFRTQFLPQIMADLHFCGDPKEGTDPSPCFPLLQKMLQSIHCEMHICVFERNQAPSIPDLPLANSTLPDNALDASKCASTGPASFGYGLPLKFFD